MGNESIGPFQTQLKLGKGTYGKTRKSVSSTNGQQICAIKILQVTQPQAKKQLERELEVIKNIGNSNILCLDDYFQIEPNKYAIKMKYIAQGNIGHNLHLQFLIKIRIFIIIAQTLQWLYLEKGLLHRDIKLENIFVLEDKVLLSDIILPDSMKILRVRNVSGGRDYLAPELLEGNSYSTASDVYSLGIVFLQVLAEKRMRDLIKLDGVQYPSIMTDYPFAAFSHITDQRMKNIVMGMVQKNPQHRPSLKDILKDLSFISQKEAKNFRLNTVTGQREALSYKKDECENGERDKYAAKVLAYNFSFDLSTPYLGHFKIINKRVQRKDYDRMRYQMVSKEPLPIGTVDINARITNFGKDSWEIVLGIITEDRKNQKNSGDSEQPNSIALWSTNSSSYSSICEDGVFLTQNLPPLKTENEALRMRINTSTGFIDWVIRGKTVYTSHIPTRYLRKRLFVFVALLGEGTVIQFT